MEPPDSEESSGSDNFVHHRPTAWQARNRFLSLFLSRTGLGVPTHKRHRVGCFGRDRVCARPRPFLPWRMRLEEPQARTVWNGQIGDVPLRVEVLPSGRIGATWKVGGAERRTVVDNVEQFERSVLFQLMLNAPPDQDSVSREVLAAIVEGKQGLPDPAMLPRARKRRRPSRRGAPRPRRR